MRCLKAVSAFLGHVLLPAVAVAQDDCRPLTDVKKLPPVTKLLDSAGIIANLPVDSSSAGEVLVSVMTGATPQVFVMDSLTAMTALGTAVRERVLLAVKPDAPNGIPAFRVRVTLRPALGVYVEPSVLCPPRGKSTRSRVSFTTTTVGPAGSTSRPPRPMEVRPRVKIGLNGEVLQVDLGSGTGVPEADRAIRQSLERERYEPARLDGRRVEVWLRDRQVELVR